MQEKAHELFNKYNPIEIDPNIPLPEKRRAMQEWWEAHDKLLIESGLSKSDLKILLKMVMLNLERGSLSF